LPKKKEKEKILKVPDPQNSILNRPFLHPKRKQALKRLNKGKKNKEGKQTKKSSKCSLGSRVK